ATDDYAAALILDAKANRLCRRVLNREHAHAHPAFIAQHNCVCAGWYGELLGAEPCARRRHDLRPMVRGAIAGVDGVSFIEARRDAGGAGRPDKPERLLS